VPGSARQLVAWVLPIRHGWTQGDGEIPINKRNSFWHKLIQNIVSCSFGNQRILPIIIRWHLFPGRHRFRKENQRRASALVRDRQHRRGGGAPGRRTHVVCVCGRRPDAEQQQRNYCEAGATSMRCCGHLGVLSTRSEARKPKPGCSPPAQVLGQPYSRSHSSDTPLTSALRSYRCGFNSMGAGPQMIRCPCSRSRAQLAVTRTSPVSGKPLRQTRGPFRRRCM
jgi:hypothetical protein